MKPLKSLYVPPRGHFKKSRFSQNSNQPVLAETNSPLPILDKSRDKC